MNVRIMKTGMMLVVTGILLVGLIMVDGCKKEEPTANMTSAEHTHEHDESDGPTHGHESMTDEPIEAVAAAVEQTKCPIMDSPINKALFVEYKGKKVYFCCPGCEDKFNAEPEKYVAKLPQFKQ
ncbi:MAG: YHS domain-containing protein [Planctomycetota bacterium]|jgi:YHS domain-containing protein